MEEILIYEPIGSMGITAKTIIEQIDSVSGEGILVRINSQGGDVFDGMAIYNSLKKYDGKVVVEIEGLAASMASLIALAGDEVKMSANSLMMIHNPSIGIQGESEDLKSKAELLDKIKDQMVGIYVGKSGISEKEVVKMMNVETWLTAEEAFGLGLVDKVTEEIKVAATHDLSIVCSKVPEWVKEKYNNINNKKEREMKEIIAMLTELKSSVNNFVDNQPKEVKIMDEDNVKEQIVNLSQKISETESVYAELEELKGLVETQAIEITNLGDDNNKLVEEINKTKATPSQVEATEDPVIETTDTKDEKTAFDNAADIFKGDSAFQFSKDK